MKSSCHFLFLMGLFCVAPLSAQKNGYSSAEFAGFSSMSNALDSSTSDLIVNVSLVNVPLSIKDMKGRWITTLDPTIIRVYEDDKPQTIQRISKDTDIPLKVGILLDISNSIAERFDFQQETARAFLASILKPSFDQVFLMSFNSEIILNQDFTDNPMLISNALSQIHPQGFTRLHDAVLDGGVKKLAPLEGRKALIIISDGDDNASSHSIRQVIRVAQNNDVVIYSVSTKPHGPGELKLSKPERGLAKMAYNTGGTAFFPSGPEEFADSFQYIAKELRSQFILAYSPTNDRKDGSYRRIKVESDQKELLLKAKKGYYAPAL